MFGVLQMTLVGVFSNTGVFDWLALKVRYITDKITAIVCTVMSSHVACVGKHVGGCLFACAV